MHKFLLLLLAGSALQAAVIRGSVMENQGGRALARARVMLEPVSGTPGAVLSVRTNSFGVFEFPTVAAGVYVATASRRNFVTVEYGQKRWNSAGTPIRVEESGSMFLSFRLPRFGAISGTVVDEEDIGLPEHDVVAYRNTRPPELAGTGKSDERGIYRISGLDPGPYLIRTVGKQYDEGGYLPTFGKASPLVDQAYIVDVSLDQQMDKADVRPAPGKLYELTIEINTSPPGMPVTLTFVSEMGRQIIKGDYYHNFVPPGSYEVFAEAPLYESPGIQDIYEPISVTKDAKMTFATLAQADTQISMLGVPADVRDSRNFQVLGRRRDLAGAGPVEILKLGAVPLRAGRWELALIPPPGYYVGGFSVLRPARRSTRPDGWNEIQVYPRPGDNARFTLSQGGGSVHGAVIDSGMPVPAAPVFLESMDLEPSKRITDVFVTRTDAQGRYQFAGLVPGRYRVLGTFEYRMPDSDAMTLSGAKDFRVENHSDTVQDLDLYIIR
jgi:hypothetical protein